MRFYNPIFVFYTCIKDSGILLTNAMEELVKLIEVANTKDDVVKLKEMLNDYKMFMSSEQYTSLIKTLVQRHNYIHNRDLHMYQKIRSDLFRMLDREIIDHKTQLWFFLLVNYYRCRNETHFESDS